MRHSLARAYRLEGTALSTGCPARAALAASTAAERRRTRSSSGRQPATRGADFVARPKFVLIVSILPPSASCADIRRVAASLMRRVDVAMSASVATACAALVSAAMVCMPEITASLASPCAYQPPYADTAITPSRATAPASNQYCGGIRRLITIARPSSRHILTTGIYSPWPTPRLRRGK